MDGSLTPGVEPPEQAFVIDTQFAPTAVVGPGAEFTGVVGFDDIARGRGPDRGGELSVGRFQRGVRS
jgi:hypothetical protein